MTAPQILHNPPGQCFVCTVDGTEAVLTYSLSGTTVDFNHTYVPHAARGRGIAALLVDAAATWARKEGLTITASCWYARDYLKLA